MPTRVEVASGEGVGKWTVPWISRRARPLGVWRRGGRGFSTVGCEEGNRDGGWRATVGMARGLLLRIQLECN